MTAEIVNLRQVRKARTRALKEAQAEENRARYGTSKAERQRRQAEADRADRQLDGAERTRQPGCPAPDEEPPAGGAG